MDKDVENFITPPDYDGEGRPHEEMDQWKIQPDDSDGSAQPPCVPGRTYSQAYQCGNPPVIKYGNCTVWVHPVTGAYCRTTCESAYVVCNRP